MLCSPHSCPGSPSVLTSCLPAPAPHTSHAGVGKSGPKANVEARPPASTAKPVARDPGSCPPPSPTRNGGLGRTSARWPLWRALPWSLTSACWQLQELPGSQVLPATVCPHEAHQRYHWSHVSTLFKLRSLLCSGQVSPKEEKIICRKSLMQKDVPVKNPSQCL